jgi:hypothetical protein
MAKQPKGVQPPKEQAPIQIVDWSIFCSHITKVWIKGGVVYIHPVTGGELLKRP